MVIATASAAPSQSKLIRFSGLKLCKSVATRVLDACAARHTGFIRESQRFAAPQAAIAAQDCRCATAWYTKCGRTRDHNPMHVDAGASMQVHAGRFRKGFGWGVIATVVMSAVMIVGMLSGLSPMPEPIPVAILGKILGGGLPKPALMALGAVAHLAYGGTFGGVLAAVTAPVTVWKGVVLGVALWLVMQVIWLPFLGWGMFGMAITPMIAGATLVLHVVYGATTGWLIDRHVHEAAGEAWRE